MPIRLADPAVADLVRPGARVDVVSVDERSKAALVLARGALVVTVHFAGPDARGPTGKGPLVLLAVPRDDATRIASVSLGRPVAVTLA